MKFPQPLWAPEGRPTSDNILSAALRNADVRIAAQKDEPHQHSAVAESADTEEPIPDLSANSELALELETMADGIAANVEQDVANHANHLEKFTEIDDRNTKRIDTHIEDLVEQEAIIQLRIERDVRLLLKTRKTRMAQQAASRILHSDDTTVIALLQEDPLNTADGAVRITADGATTEGGAKVPFRSAETNKGDGTSSDEETK